MAEIIAICNQKGGVGKTTTSINLSAALAAAEKRTLLIDMDAQGNATTGMGFNKHDVEMSIYDVIADEIDIRRAIQSTDLTYLKMIAANASLVGADIELVNAVSRETLLKNNIAPIFDDFDYIILDCPPSLGLITLNALVAAESVIIPVQCEYYAMEGIADLQKTITLIQNSLNSNLKIKGIVLTMFDARNNLAHQVQNEIRNHFKNNVFQVVIPRNVRLSEAPSHGKPILLYDVSSKGSISYFELANEVISTSSAAQIQMASVNE